MTNEIISSIEGITWPAIPGASAAARLAGLFQLEQSQWWDEVQIRRKQFATIESGLKYAIKTVPLYRQKYAELIDDINQKSIQEYWQRLPILTRQELQQAGEKILSTALPKGHGKAQSTQTSGSTGEPVKIWLTGVTQYFWNIFTLRDHLWHQRDFSQTLASIRAYRHLIKSKPQESGHRTENWGMATAGLYKTGASVMLDVGMDISQQVNWLTKHQPGYLLTYPSNLQALIQYTITHNIKISGLKQVRTISEIATPQLRRSCQSHWQAPLVDTYSSQEFGYIALQCPLHTHYHIQSENVLVEILDEHNQPVASGEIGRLVVTSLHNYASPLIRYEIGDYAEAGEPCDCGRGLPVINQILGRSRNMLIMPDGEQRWPIFGFGHFRDIAPIQQFQCIQKTNTHLYFRLVAERAVSPAEEEKLKAIIQQMMGYPFTINFDYVATIPRNAAGKYEEFICEI